MLSFVGRIERVTFAKGMFFFQIKIIRSFFNFFCFFLCKEIFCSLNKNRLNFFKW